MMKFSRITALSAVILIALVTIVGKGGDDAPATPPTPPANIAGTWLVTGIPTMDTCDLQPGDADLGILEITQNGANVTIIDSDGETYTGTLNGDVLTFTGTFVDGTETVTLNGTATFNGDSMSGTVDFTLTDQGFTCGGSIDIQGARISGGGGTGTAEGLWEGATSDSRALAGLVLDNGEYWFVYSQSSNPDVIGGVLQGTGTSDNGSFTSSDGKDFDVDGGIRDVTVSAIYVEKVTLDGMISDSMNQTTFVSIYDSLYDETPSLSMLAGTYAGAAANQAGREMATVTVDPNGDITGSTASGCMFTGTASVHATGNVFDVSITFSGGVCDNGTDTVTGPAVFDDTDNTLVTAAINAARDNGIIFLGAKP